jgi:two-component system, NarL family, nitrate/nitrite response regulator NarL
MSRGPHSLVVIASASLEIRRRVKRSLHKIYVVRESTSLDKLNQVLDELRPSVLLLDLALLGGDYRKMIAFHLENSPKVILLSAAANEQEQLLAIKAGASGYCNKDIDPVLLRKAVEMVQKGEIWVGRRIINYLLNEVSEQNERFKRTDSVVLRNRLAHLTSREKEIAISVGRGASNKEIAQRLNITEATVKAHLTVIFKKLGLSDRLSLALFVAAQDGFKVLA